MLRREVRLASREAVVQELRAGPNATAVRWVLEYALVADVTLSHIRHPVVSRDRMSDRAGLLRLASPSLCIHRPPFTSLVLLGSSWHENWREDDARGCQET
jgi:hypothetical protein